MNNMTFGESYKSKKIVDSEEKKTKKKIDYKKEIAELEKILGKLNEKYESSPHTYASNCIGEIKSAIWNLRRIDESKNI